MTSKQETIKEKFEKWYYSQKFVPHGLMWTNHSFEGFKQGYRQALADVEKLLDKLPEDAGLWLMEKIDNLKAKGQ